MLNDVRPYLVPRPGTVFLGPWELLDGEWSPLPQEFDGWDSGTDLVIRRTVRVETDRFRQETGLDLTQTSFAVSWTSSTTGMRDALPPINLAANGLDVFEARLPGDRIAGSVDIRTSLCLARPSDAQPPGVARLPGSVLAEHHQRVVLDRGDQLFPVDAIDFAATRLPPDAAWHLETSTDLAAPFFGSFRVLVNTRDTELAQAVARGARDKRQQALLDDLESGVATVLAEMAVMLQDELNDRPDWPQDSIGDVLGRFLSATGLSGMPAPGAADLALFRTRVSAAVRAGGKGRQFR